MSDTEPAGQREMCRNCGRALEGVYCHNCGEPRPDPHELSWKHFVRHGAHELTHLDSKIFRTVWLLVRRPGFLTAEYWAGRRTAYIRPLRLYILFAAIHLVAGSASFYRLDLFRQGGDDEGIDRAIAQIAAVHGTTTERMEAVINQKLQVIYSVLQYVAVAAFAWIPMLLYRRRQPYYVAQLIFALHIYSAYFLVVALVTRFLTVEQWVRSPTPLILAIYIFFAVRRVYGESIWRSLWKTAVLRIGLFATEVVALGISLPLSILWAAVAGPPS
jgi:hypothetical protein